MIQDKKTGKFLATQRHEHMSFGGKWVLPGGHLEQGEPIL
jgi:8-oxo-dGTP pyrophosphatase MutT (NUDIX family)